MKKFLPILFIFCAFISAAMAEESIESEVGKAREMWETAKYKTENTDKKLALFQSCVDYAKGLSEKFKNRAEPIIWQGICLVSQGEFQKSSAISKAKEAKSLFEKTIAIDSKALEGAAYLNLAVLYQRIPSWPVGFGDKTKSEENFKKALAISPQNMDAHYFYGLFLTEEKRYDEARKQLSLALNCPNKNRSFMDQKRREEIKLALKQLDEKIAK